MEQVRYCVWCGQDNPADQLLCSKCHRHLDAKENLLLDFLLEHTKDKFKGDVQDGLFSAIKNYLLSHLYSVIITISLVITAVTAVVTSLSSDPVIHSNAATHITPVDRFPETRPVVFEEKSQPEAYTLTDSDQEEISACLAGFAEQMMMTGYVGDDYDYLAFLISDELEKALGYDSYVDMYPDHVDDELYPSYFIHHNEISFDHNTWSTQPLTQNGQQLVEMGYTIATVYVDYSFYGKLDGIHQEGVEPAMDELIGSPRYLMTFTLENGKWLLVEQINVKDRYEQRKDALL